MFSISPKYKINSEKSVGQDFREREKRRTERREGQTRRKREEGKRKNVKKKEETERMRN